MNLGKDVCIFKFVSVDILLMQAHVTDLGEVIIWVKVHVVPSKHHIYATFNFERG